MSVAAPSTRGDSSGGAILPRSKKLLKRGFEVILYETRGRCSCAQEMLEQSFEHAVRLFKKSRAVKMIKKLLWRRVKFFREVDGQSQTSYTLLFIYV